MPTAGANTGSSLHATQRIGHVTLLLCFGHVLRDHAVYAASMSCDLPIAAQTLPGNDGIMARNVRIERDCGPQSEPIECLHYAEDADAIAVLAAGEVAEIGVGAAAEEPGEIGRNKGRGGLA